jgi:hypothetical protein
MSWLVQWIRRLWKRPWPAHFELGLIANPKPLC